MQLKEVKMPDISPERREALKAKAKDIIKELVTLPRLSLTTKPVLAADEIENAFSTLLLCLEGDTSVSFRSVEEMSVLSLEINKSNDVEGTQDMLSLLSDMLRLDVLNVSELIKAAEDAAFISRVTLHVIERAKNN